MLIIISNSHYKDASLQDALAKVSADDALLLIQDAVYAIKDPEFLAFLAGKGASLYLLKEDASARGISQIPAQITPVSYTNWVELSIQHPQSLTL